MPRIDADVGSVVCRINDSFAKVVCHQPVADCAKSYRRHYFGVRSNAGDAGAVVEAGRGDRGDVVAVGDSHPMSSAQDIAVVLYEIVAIAIVHKPVPVVINSVAADLAGVLPNVGMEFRAVDMYPAVNDLYHFG
jgi:hypothetical protein